MDLILALLISVLFKDRKRANTTTTTALLEAVPTRHLPRCHPSSSPQDKAARAQRVTTAWTLKFRTHTLNSKRTRRTRPSQKSCLMYRRRPPDVHTVEREVSVLRTTVPSQDLEGCVGCRDSLTSARHPKHLPRTGTVETPVSHLVQLRLRIPTGITRRRLTSYLYMC